MWSHPLSKNKNLQIVFRRYWSKIVQKHYGCSKDTSVIVRKETKLTDKAENAAFALDSQTESSLVATQFLRS